MNLAKARLSLLQQFDLVAVQRPIGSVALQGDRPHYVTTPRGDLLRRPMHRSYAGDFRRTSKHSVTHGCTVPLLRRMLAQGCS